MAFFDLTTAVALTKRLYPDGLTSILMEKNPAFGLGKKWTKFRAEGKFLVWRHAPGAGGSSSFSDAQEGKGAATFKRPFIQRKKEYGLGSIDGETMDATVGDKYAVAEAFQVALSDAMYNVQRSVGINTYGNGGGSRGQDDGNYVAASTTLVLSRASDAKNFEVGMRVQSASTDGTSGAVRNGFVTITGISGSTLTADQAWDTGITGFSASDYLFRKGDFGNVFTGFGRPGSKAGWVPVVAPTAGESHFGVDRSSNVERLCGQRHAPGGGLMEDILIDLATLICDTGHNASPDTCFINPRDWGSAVKEIGSKRFIDVKATNPRVGYRGLEIDGPDGPIALIPDPNCPRYQAWMGDISTLEWWCLGEVPRILQRSGDATQREANDDAEELRVGGYLQMVVSDPSSWGTCTFPS